MVSYHHHVAQAATMHWNHHAAM